MQRITIYTLLVLFLPFTLLAQAGDDRLKELKDASQKEGEGWVTGGALGLDFSSLALFNPRIGSGDNRIAFGGLGTLFANYKKERVTWASNLSLQLAAQKLADIDWQKSLDILRLNSQADYAFANPKWGIGGILTFESLALPTYPGNYLDPQEDADLVQAQFLSPARLEVSPGISYKPTEHLNFFLAPAGYKLIYIADQDIANLGVHGTKLVDENDPAQGYEQSFHQVGARLVGNYTNKYFNDKISFSSRLDLFSNYLNNPQNIDVLWQNNLGWEIWGGISLNYMLETFYDHDIKVIRERATDTTPEEIGRATSWTSALLIKYNFIF